MAKSSEEYAGDLKSTNMKNYSKSHLDRSITRNHKSGPSRVTCWWHAQIF